MRPIRIMCLRASLVALLLLLLLRPSSSAASAPLDEGDDPTPRTPLRSHERHERRRRAMAAAVASAPDAFPSVREQRSYYYFHAGVEAAYKHAVTMAGGEAEEGGDRLEEALERELERITAALEEVERAAAAVPREEDVNLVDAEEGAPAVPYEQKLQHLFAQQYLHYDCGAHPAITLAEAEGLWEAFHRRFWEHTVGTRDAPADMERTPHPQLYVNATEEGGGTVPRQLRLFAARDFDEGDTVYTQRTNRAYFQAVPTWMDFLRSLPTTREACLALEWSTMKQLSRPGRWLVGLVLDEGAFLRRGTEGGDEGTDEEEAEGNVVLDDERGLEYVAVRDIRRGEELVERAVDIEEEAGI